jgi:hypothetical protein
MTIEKFIIFCFIILLTTFAGVGSASAIDCEIITGSGYSSGVNEGWHVDHYSFYNYCPHCHHINCLEVGLKRQDEITCNHCDADYSFSGKEKVYRYPYYLTPYIPEPEPTISKMETVQPEPTPWQKAHACFQTNEILF